MMIKVNFLPDDLIEICVEDTIDDAEWQNYQDTIWNILEEREEKSYVIANFLNATKFSPALLSEFGTGRHLKHPRLGFIVLIGGNPLVNFALTYTEHNASNAPLRIHNDRDAALEFLRMRRQFDIEVNKMRE
jgi:hypothetical protein